jgi:hypothetical protein
MLLAMQAAPVAAASDMTTRYQVYGTILDFLVLTALLGIISLIRYFIARSRRRAHRREKVAVS